MDKQHYRDLLKELTLPLFDLTDENDKFILNDKRMDIAVEIGNLLFRLSDKLTYQNEEFEIVNLLTGSKKQKKTLNLFNFMINFLIYRLEDVIVNINDQLDILLRERFADVTDYIVNTEDIIWDQSLFDDVRKQLQDDVARARYKPSGTKGFGKCGRCNSEELYVNEKQTRSCDEPMTVNYLCIPCGHTWRRG